MINLKLLSKGLRGNLTPSEFITLFVIESALGKDNTPKKIYNEMISDLTNLSLSQVKRCTKSLVEKGFILKQVIQKNRLKRETFYTLNLNKNEQKNDEIEFTGEPSKQSKTIKNNLKQYKTTENNTKQSVKENINNNMALNYNIIEKSINSDSDRKKQLEEELRQWSLMVNSNKG